MSHQDTGRRRAAGNGDVEVADAAPLPAHISRIHTRSPDEHYAWLAVRYAHHQRRVRAGAHGFEFFSETGSLGALSFIRSRYRAATAYAEWPPVAHVMAPHVYSGRCVLNWKGSEVRVPPRGAVLIPPDNFSMLLDTAAYASLLMPMDVVRRVAEETTGLAPDDFRFTGLLPVSADAQRQWLITTDFMQRSIYSRSLESPLLRAAAEQMAAASLLATFPNTAMTTEIRTPGDPATPATVRRATAFIDEHADEPISVSDIAAGAGVAPRTVQAAFRRYRYTTPTAYLRRVRLARAHEQLMAAQPGDGTTVAAVAACWGFASPHRFAAAYRRAYGQDPGRTLHP
ncbi:helix-turn-helix transcriptional regulator [Krasilnikovia sp. MM14-A1004]|uniref:helix-turn-helix transcriptional regulator n=1 Tax=Krasilnikovia sp. MM14-A1004 TaxID=3373541 RepID=UPI00399D5203